MKNLKSLQSNSFSPIQKITSTSLKKLSLPNSSKKKETISNPTAIFHPTNLLLLGLGGLSMVFGNGRMFVALMAWVYPILFLRFTRRTKVIKGYLLLSIVMAIAAQISFYKFTGDDPSNVLFFIPAMFGPVLALPFLIDRLLYKNAKGIWSTLVFPFAYVLVEFLYSLNPYGSNGVLGYTQFENLVLSQWASVMGIWGISFLIYWTAAVVNWLITSIKENKFKSNITGIYIYTSIIASILLFGFIRLQIAIPSTSTNISGIHVHENRYGSGIDLWNASKNDIPKFRSLSASIQQDLFDKTIVEADQGAAIVVWSECSPPLYKSDETEFLQKAAEAAKAKGIHLVVNPYVVSNDSEKRNENKLLIFGPNGDQVLTHYKYGGNIFEGTVLGDKKLRHIDTEHGRMSGVICWDHDFPLVMNQTGKKDIDIVFGPAADWKEITPLHAAIGYYRSIENGYAMVRQTMNGQSIISDAKGKMISTMNHYETTDWTNRAAVPIKGVKTFYSYFNHLMIWMAAAGLFYFCFLSFFNKRRII